MLAAWRGHEATAQFLLERGANENLADMDGATARRLAMRGRHTAILRLLDKQESGTTVRPKSPKSVQNTNNRKR